jgi:predicted regulator of Ras-like GTPase activity (Roadblock/LC7/MglB family)
VPDISMTDVLSEMATRLEGIRLLAVVDSDCMVLAYWQSTDNEVSPEALGEFIQQVKYAMSTFRPSADGVSKLDDIVLSISSSYMMLKPICNGDCFIVADAPKNVSLGSIRAAFTSFTSRLEQTIPGHEPIAPGSQNQ